MPLYKGNVFLMTQRMWVSSSIAAWRCTVIHQIDALHTQRALGRELQGCSWETENIFFQALPGGLATAAPGKQSWWSASLLIASTPGKKALVWFYYYSQAKRMPYAAKGPSGWERTWTENQLWLVETTKSRIQWRQSKPAPFEPSRRLLHCSRLSC